MCVCLCVRVDGVARKEQELAEAERVSHDLRSALHANQARFAFCHVFRVCQPIP